MNLSKVRGSGRKGRIIKEDVQNFVKEALRFLESGKGQGLDLLPWPEVDFDQFGKTETEKRKLINDAKELEKSGAFGIVLECIYSDISKKITNLIKIPTIGIGASVHCDGQVLVTDDILGLTNAKIKFVKKYTNVKKIVNSAVLKFKKEVKSKKYPSKKYSY